MLVNNENLTTIWFDDNKSLVQIIDQRFLPHQLKIVTLSSFCLLYTSDAADE